jgi:tRNA pseudouridine38-40 synthase
MKRYFIEVAYNGAAYAGFQVQENANTIQAEIERALQIFFRQPFELTGSSRTDAGVHARQNFFHMDSDAFETAASWKRAVYNLNAILPSDIVIRQIIPVSPDMHARFSATAREYRYYLYQQKNPFLDDRAYYFPYQLDIDRMMEAAALLKSYTDFTSFSKRHTQVKSFECKLEISEWVKDGACWVYHVQGNRFLRGMVRGLTGTMLRVGTGKISLDDFRQIIESRDCTRADFSVPPQGLFLERVHYPFPVG